MKNENGNYEEEDTIELLKRAVDNEKNENMLDITSKKIEHIKYNVLKKMVKINEKYMNECLSKLKDYIYVDTVDNLKQGSYLRWFKINNDNHLKKKKKEEVLLLNNGGILMDIKITDNDIYLVFKNFNNKHYSLKYNDLITFQKLNNQELIILLAMDFLDDKK